MPDVARASVALTVPWTDRAEECFHALVSACDLRHGWVASVPTAVASRYDLDELPGTSVASEWRHPGAITAVREYALRDAMVLVQVRGGAATIRVAGTDPDEVDTAGHEFLTLLRASAPTAEDTEITFWAHGPGGAPRALVRRIPTVAWPQAEHGYGADVRAQMARLLAIEAMPAARLLLWHGPPGTGKTYALRALAKVWSPWCSTHVVSDPERFFDDVAHYLLEVVTGGGPTRSAAPSGPKLVVVEDAGELMSLTAASEARTALNRVLNLTDGILGQGLDVLVLITTNEPLGSLHPAVTRPGRCLAEIEFGALTADEADAWLRVHGCAEAVDGPRTLAELYALLRGDAPAQPPRRAVGFAR